MIKRGFHDHVCYTFDSYFFKGGVNGDIEIFEGKTIFIEEYSMIPNEWMIKIYQAHCKYKNKIYLFDSQQCSSVEPGSQIHYNYHDSETITKTTGKQKKHEYIKGCGRYDKKKQNIE